jgi:hypothetical protein
LAAAERADAPFVAAPFFAAAERLAADRRLAAAFVCFDIAALDAPRPLSRLSTDVAARERLAFDSALALRFAVDFAVDFLPAAESFLSALKKRIYWDGPLTFHRADTESPETDLRTPP